MNQDLLADDDIFSDRLDAVQHKLNKCSNNLSSALLANSILSRDLMSLNSEIFEYDNKVNQLNYDSLCASEFSSKLEGLVVRAQFFEAQIDVLENHARYKAARSHRRLPSVNDLKDEVLDWRTTETTLENLYQEFDYLKRQFAQCSLTGSNYTVTAVSPVLTRFPSLASPINSFSGFRTPDQQHVDSFEKPGKKHGPSLSISTTATSLFDETANLRPLRCSSKKLKRMSTQTINGNFSEVPMSLEPVELPVAREVEHYQNLFEDIDSTVIHSTFIGNSKRRSLSTSSLNNLINETYRGDVFIDAKQKEEPKPTKGLTHFKSYQGLNIHYHQNKEEDYQYKFPAPVSVTTDVTIPSNFDVAKSVDNQTQTLDWLSKIAGVSSPKKPAAPLIQRRDSISEPLLDVTASVSFSASKENGGQLTSQSILLDMINKQKTKEKQLETQLRSTSFFGSRRDLLSSLSKNLVNFQPNLVRSPISEHPDESIDNQESPEVRGSLESTASSEFSEPQSVEDYPSTKQNLNSEKKQWSDMFSKLLNNSTITYMFDRNNKEEYNAQSDCVSTDTLSEVDIEPAAENSQILASELQLALQSDMSF